MEGIIFVGIQATGKSSFYKENFFRTHVRINLDMLKTRNRENIILDACIEAKQPVVIDNTNVTRKDRIKYINKFKDSHYKIIVYYFKSHIEEAKTRNNSRNNKEKIPLKGILNTYNKLEIPSVEEGVDLLYYISISGEGKFRVEEWKDEV